MKELNSELLAEIRKKSSWALYLRYGFDPYGDRYTGQVRRVERDDILEALSDPEYREYARSVIKQKLQEIAELDEMLYEALPETERE